MEKSLAILENVTEEEVKLAIDTINRNREIEAWKEKKMFLENELNKVLTLIDELGGKVVLNGGYVYVNSELNSRYESKIRIKNKKYSWLD